ncbi:MAG TPA: aspartate dehydrogenase [Candidatus Methylomirabilis sp.]|nr:aspartate dehydrogenase [Candidatus Methylomirabilis sp.]
MSSLKIGIVGCGTIGTTLAQAIDAGRILARLAGLTSRTRTRAEALARSLRTSPPVLTLPELVQASDCVVEAATGNALAEIVPACLREGRDVFVISVGGLLGHEEWFREAEARGCRILYPSGAIAGLDGVRAAARGRVDSVTLTTRKPPTGLAGAPYVVERGINLEALTQETLLFEGTAREACKGFPTNVNVSAALSLAGIGPDRTRVRIFAVPGGALNQHRIEVRGEFGRLSIEIENVPSPTNPRTGLLSIFSSIAFLADYARSTAPRRESS